jgi:hypothetical protein
MMMDHTRPEYAAALRIAERAHVNGYTPAQLAELMITAPMSPAYAQLQTLACGEDAALHEGTKVLSRIFNTGYSPQTGRFWDLPALYPTIEAMSDAVFHLALLFHRLGILRKLGNPVPIVWDAIAQLLFGDQAAVITELAATGEEGFKGIWSTHRNVPENCGIWMVNYRKEAR